MPRAFYGWYIALAGATSNFFVLGIVMIGASVFVDPIREEMGWRCAWRSGGRSRLLGRL